MVFLLTFLQFCLNSATGNGNSYTELKLNLQEIMCASELLKQLKILWGAFTFLIQLCSQFHYPCEVLFTLIALKAYFLLKP